MKTDRIDFNDENSNTSNNTGFDAVLQARLARRSLLRGSVGMRPRSATIVITRNEGGKIGT